MFGRNTTAGSVSFVSRKPAQEFDARANVGLGSYETVVADAAIGGGISDTVSVRLAGKWDYQAKGFYDNTLTGKDIGRTNTFSPRASLRWEPTGDFELNFNVHGGRDRSENHPWVAVGISDPALPVADPAFPGGRRFSDAVNRLAVSQDSYWLVNARVGIETQRPGGNWSVSFRVKNLADKEYFGQIFQSGTANAMSATAGNPRTWGFEAKYQF